MILSKWIIGARLKTLSAALSPVLIGTSFSQNIILLNFILALIVACSLQIGVNLANDYSDGVRGTDLNRIGPTRLVASGLASAKAVKRASIACFSVAAIAGLILSSRTNQWLILIGAISILAAWGYTGGKKPYGYFGFGEISVFIFFGVIATVGSYYVQSLELNLQIFILSLPVGALSCAILVVNNLRDLKTDMSAGKRTLAVILGENRSRYFYIGLVNFSQIISVLTFFIKPELLITIISLPLTIKVSIKILKGASGRDLIGILAKTAQLQLIQATLTSLALLT
jgi:1,4-dihydroxy-2-naphthoate octaprenyltransferase